MRATSRNNETLDRISDLGIEYIDESAKHPHLPEGGYVARNMHDKNGNSLPLAPSAITGACRMLGTKFKMFAGCEDRDAFPKLLRNNLDNPNRGGDHTFKVRTGFAENGIDEVVKAILPGSYEYRDANVQLANFASLCTENIGPIRGVEVEEHGFGDSLMYRFIMGNNIMPKQGDLKGQFVAFCLHMSEHGLFPDTAQLGLWRLICKNGAMGFDNATIATWTHRSDMMDYMNKAGRTIQAAGGIADIWSGTFGRMSETKLDRPAADMLFDMRARGLITESHWDAADAHQKSGMEPEETQYDLFNVLTRAAQDLPGMRQRQGAERRVLKIFTEGDGVSAALAKARDVAQPGTIGTRGHERPQPAFQLQIRDLVRD
jgi:hypothetical protein